MLDPGLREPLIAKLTALADDEVVLAQRLSEWVAHAPILEEDIAIANLAQDELGHAKLYLELRRELDGSDPDQLVFFRDPLEYQNAVLVELPKGDWAFTMVRQYLFDLYENLWLEEARRSAYPPLAEAAERILKEERFHLRHSALWMERLGLGTEESHARAQEALETLFPYAKQLFVPLEGEEALVEAGYVPDLKALQDRYLEEATRHLERSGLRVPERGYVPKSRKEHTEYLWSLLAEMQSVARWDPEAKAW
ncbi:phenylacetate-CoA oxygenase subunit PaaI [Thermus composti]|uniref:1,2-phenylacetyl-CoA epoxidase subunit PaaC n=1 Tax=Thermus composti TaxID=532059 RepID=A0ABV6PYS2_9DEIN|nr:1,2-phenylacetyl-CoA epoxidase subunit PaaC [Thermus composti]GGM93256.1 phenylacetate-CoA oxygenase subunit PaaI [Thermus composti]